MSPEMLDTIILGDCLEVMATLPDNCADLIVADPPYFTTGKAEVGDTQWRTPDAYLAWVGHLCAQWYRLLKPNGSLYCFAAPDMAARVEVAIGERFNVLNHIVWVKEQGWHQKTDKEELRAYLSPTERIIFAEHCGADNVAKGEAGYERECHKMRRSLFASYIQQERERAGYTRGQVEVALGYVSKSDPMRGSALCYRWEEGSSLPTREAYEKMRAFLNSGLSTAEYLRKDYEYLRKDYEYLRRPFFVTQETPHTDVWTFPTVPPRWSKHPCEKPLAMLEHIVTASSKPGAVVLDPFMGSAATAEACLQTGRHFIGVEVSPRYHREALRRLAHVVIRPRLFVDEVPRKESRPVFVVAPLFAGVGS